jgi:hypothetical protein
MKRDVDAIRLYARFHLLCASLFLGVAVPAAWSALTLERKLAATEGSIALFLVALGVLRLVLSIGLSDLRPWARPGLIAFSVFSAAAWSLLTIACPPLLLVSFGCVIFHLNTVSVLSRPTVRVLFGQPAARVSF